MSSFLRLILDLLIVINLLSLILLPWLLRMIYDNPDLLTQLEHSAEVRQPGAEMPVEYPSDLPPSSYPFYLGFFYAAGCGTAWILLEGHFILRRLQQNEPFAAGQAASFRRVSLAFAWLMAAFALKIAVYNTLLTMFCCGLFLLLVFIAQVLAEIFRQANLVKAENELTI